MVAPFFYNLLRVDYFHGASWEYIQNYRLIRAFKSSSHVQINMIRLAITHNS